MSRKLLTYEELVNRPVSELTRGEKVILFIEAFCVVPEGKLVGKPMRLDPFQRRFILDVYDNSVPTSLAILCMARKNGKTALIACLLIVHIVGPEAIRNSQIISGATTRDQASLIFNLAKKILDMSPRLRQLVYIRSSRREIIGLNKNVEFKAISSEATGAHGLSPIVAILDEMGQVKSPQSAFVDAITSAQGAHENPIIFVISTQAPSDASLLSVWIDDAKKSGDPSIVCHVYEADPSADVLDEEAWAAANPALGTFRSIADVRKQAQKASRMPAAEASFRNLVLNQRVAQTASLFSPSVWKECGGASDEALFKSGVVYGGLDLSARLDLTALSLLTEDSAGTWHSRNYFWTPGDTLRDRAEQDRAPYELWRDQGFLRALPGASINYATLAKEIIELVEDLDLAVIAVDRWRFDQVEQEVNNLGQSLPFLKYGQGYKDMSPALDAWEHVVLEKRLRHGGNPVMTFCVSNATVVSDPAGNKKLDKSKARGRIDGAQAMAMAFGVASQNATAIDIETMIA